MPSTGRLYGLRQSPYLDERRDPHQSTEAACLYLRYLHGIFNDWELALAAFNSGPGRVSRAIKRSGRHSFWKLYRSLPRETRSYLPQFVAITYIMNYYPYYNLFPKNHFFMVDSDTVHITQGLDLDQLSEALSLCKNQLRSMNPAYVWGIVPKDAHKHVLRLPRHKKEAFDTLRKQGLALVVEASAASLDQMASKLSRPVASKRRISYKIRKGDALSTIAMRYGLRVSDIKRWNRLKSHRIQAGQRLRLWIPKGRTLASSRSSTRKQIPSSRSKSSSYYIVQRGDTLWSIANQRSTQRYRS